MLALVYFGEQEQRPEPLAGGGDANEPIRYICIYTYIYIYTYTYISTYWWGGCQGGH
jgi:hypothetical protein